MRHATSPRFVAEHRPEPELRGDEGDRQGRERDETAPHRSREDAGQRARRGRRRRLAAAGRQEEAHDQDKPGPAGDAPRGLWGGDCQAQEEQAECGAQGAPPRARSRLAALKTGPKQQGEAQSQESGTHCGESAPEPQVTHGERREGLHEPNAAESHAAAPVVDQGQRHRRAAAIEQSGGDDRLHSACRACLSAARRAASSGAVEGRDGPAVHQDAEVRARIAGGDVEVPECGRPRPTRSDVEAKRAGGRYLDGNRDGMGRSTRPLIRRARQPGGHASPGHAGPHLDLRRAQEKPADRSGGILGGEVDQLPSPDSGDRGGDEDQGHAQAIRGVLGAPYVPYARPPRTGHRARTPKRRVTHGGASRTDPAMPQPGSVAAREGLCENPVVPKGGLEPPHPCGH